VENTIQLITALVSCLGFAVVFNIKRQRLLFAGIGGFLSWAVYLLMGSLGVQDVACYFISSVAVTIYSEVLARILKCPATLFLVVGTIPLIPGGALYNTMRCFMEGDLQAVSGRALTTVLIAVAIAVGMLCPMSLFQLVRRARSMKDKKN